MADEREPKQPGVRIVRRPSPPTPEEVLRGTRQVLGVPFLAILTFATIVWLGLGVIESLVSYLTSTFGWEHWHQAIYLTLGGIWLLVTLCLVVWATWKLCRWATHRNH
jgi:hypothetical protein